jgi:hypothetical protein
MLERVVAEANAFGVPRTTALRSAAHAALLRRDVQVHDDHDTRLLHPARTLLILMADTGCRDPGILVAASLAESVDAELRPDPRELGELEPGARTLADSVPASRGSEDEDERALLLERLVSLDEAAAEIALAERLDHARHLHLRRDLPWRSFHREIEDVYLPLARRVSTPLARRLDRWAEAFGRRLLLRPET